jgi:stearoyl-CoA desaturase (delta-9 desaturase)
MHHSTFCVNSLAHFLGESNFSDYHTARDSTITALVSFGEGYHNYHHEFPQDYRNGIEMYHYDPGKWLIAFFAIFGLTFNLKRTHSSEIKRARSLMTEKIQNSVEETRSLGESTLPLEISTEEFFRVVKTHDKRWIIVDQKIYDVNTFAGVHPGGRSVLLNWIGKDATQVFKGNDSGHQHYHSEVAQKFLDQLRVDKVKLKV